MPQYEYMQMIFVEYRKGALMKQLNELGAEGWGPALAVGRTVILYREVGAMAETAKGLPDADIEDWRALYPVLTESELADISADDIEKLMGEDFALPTRATLNRWANEARESV